ncbi:MAG TPA: cytochrome c oxidase assembly protein [Terriglobales bacterium]|nr:cytochrome c oxidase assembly protein [Terriglobales bacterium]
MQHAHHVGFESLWASAALILAWLVYLRGWLCVRRLHLDTIELWRAGSLLFGLFFIWVAAASPLAALDHELLTVHMIQHLLLMTLAPPLLWLGAPAKPLLHGLPPQFAQALISRLFRSAPVQRLMRALAHPAVCWVGAAATLVGWHIPPAFRLGLQSELWHGIEQASFLATGLLFWWPVVPPLPSVKKPEWLIIVYLFLATLPCDILSGFLVFCDRVVYPVYLSSPQPLGLSALADQQRAGALMWTCVTVVYLIAGAIFTARLLSPQRAREYWIPQSDSQGNAVPHTVGHSMEAL